MPHAPPLGAHSHCFLTPPFIFTTYDIKLVSPRFPYCSLIARFSQRPNTSADLLFYRKARLSSSYNMPSRPRAGGRQPLSREVSISKALSYVLRHGAEKEGLRLDDGGWAHASDVVCPSTVQWTLFYCAPLLCFRTFAVQHKFDLKNETFKEPYIKADESLYQSISRPRESFNMQRYPRDFHRSLLLVSHEFST